MYQFKYKDIDFAHKYDTASNPQDEYYNHMHYFNEIIFFVGGDVTYTVEAETVVLNVGDIILIPSGKYHFASVNKDKIYERYVFKFPNEIIPPSLVEKIRKNKVFHHGRSDLSIGFSQSDLYFEKYKDDDLYILLLCELTKTLLFLCEEQPENKPYSNNLLSSIIEYIDMNLESVITLESLSNAFNYSKNYIGGLFKKYMKIPPMQYIKIKKIIYAHEMILSGKKKCEVAKILGFEDYSTFYRSYIKIMGKPPADGKKNKKVNQTT